MDTQGFAAGPLSALCIVALVVGTASAAVITAADTTSNPDGNPVHPHPSPESIINALEQQGVEVTDVKTSLQNDDTEAVQTWLRTYFRTHQPERPGRSGRSPPDLTNSTQQQNIITRLEAEGVDVTEANTALRNGDSDAVQAWLEAYFQAHRPARAPPDLSDPAQKQRIIDRLAERGVDVTGVEADLQNGDTTAVQAWLETYLPSHEGEMGFHRPPEPVSQVETGG